MIARSYARMIVGLGLAASAWGCGGPTEPYSGGEVQITLAVTGGIAGVDWQYTVDGRTGRIVGDRCSGSVGCDWGAGQELATFVPDTLTPLAGEFFTRGFFEGPTDYGSECCDQFDYVLTFQDPDNDRAVTGSDGTLPQDILGLIQLLEQFVADRRAERLEASA